MEEKLTDEEKAECRALKSIFEAKKKGLKLTQESAGAAMGISQSAVGHYLHDRNAINQVNRKVDRLEMRMDSMEATLQDIKKAVTK